MGYLLDNSEILVYGSWYFCSRSSQSMPSHPTLGAFKRAITYSFGSISFGSLIVSIIQLLHQLCSAVQRNVEGDDCLFTCVTSCCLSYMLSVIESLTEFFNVGDPLTLQCECTDSHGKIIALFVFLYRFVW